MRFRRPAACTRATVLQVIHSLAVFRDEWGWNVCILLLHCHKSGSDFSDWPAVRAVFHTLKHLFFIHCYLTTWTVWKEHVILIQAEDAGSEIPLNLSILGVISEEGQQCGPALHTKAPCSLLFYTWLSRKLPPSLTHHLRAAVLTKLLNESLLRRSRPLSETFTFSTTEVLLWLTFRKPQSLDTLKSRNTHKCTGKYRLQFGTNGLRSVIP